MKRLQHYFSASSVDQPNKRNRVAVEDNPVVVGKINKKRNSSLDGFTAGNVDEAVKNRK